MLNLQLKYKKIGMEQNRMVYVKGIKFVKDSELTKEEKLQCNKIFSIQTKQHSNLTTLVSDLTRTLSKTMPKE
jgi:hypothetical protein